MSFNVTVMCKPEFGGTFLRIRFALFVWLESLSSIQKKSMTNCSKNICFEFIITVQILSFKKCNFYFKTIWRIVSIRALSGDLNAELEVPQRSFLAQRFFSLHKRSCKWWHNFILKKCANNRQSLPIDFQTDNNYTHGTIVLRKVYICKVELIEALDMGQNTYYKT